MHCLCSVCSVLNRTDGTVKGSQLIYKLFDLRFHSFSKAFLYPVHATHGPMLCLNLTCEGSCVHCVCVVHCAASPS